MDDLARENFITFQIEMQHTGPQFRALTGSLNKMGLKKLPRSF